MRRLLAILLTKRAHVVIIIIHKLRLISGSPTSVVVLILKWILWDQEMNT